MYWLPYSSRTSHHPSQTPCLPWTSHATQKLMLIHARCSKSSLKHSIRFCGIFSNRILLHIVLLKCRHVQIAFLKFTSFIRVYSNCCCGFLFEPEIKIINQSSNKMYSNNILNFQESATMLNALTIKVWKLKVCTSLLGLDRNTWNNLTVSKEMSSNNSFKNRITHPVFTNKSYMMLQS